VCCSATASRSSGHEEDSLLDKLECIDTFCYVGVCRRSEVNGVREIGGSRHTWDCVCVKKGLLNLVCIKNGLWIELGGWSKTAQPGMMMMTMMILLRHSV